MRTIRELLAATRDMIANAAASNRHALGDGVPPGLYSPAESLDRSLESLYATQERLADPGRARATARYRLPVTLTDEPTWFERQEQKALEAKRIHLAAVIAERGNTTVKHYREWEAAKQLADAWEAHRDWLNANAWDLEAVVGHYRSRIRMRRRFIAYTPKYPNHSGKYRWVVPTETPNADAASRGVPNAKHNILADAPELAYRKALRWFLRADGITEVNLHTVERLLDERAADIGSAAWQEAARMHGYWKSQQRQDTKQDRYQRSPVVDLENLARTQRLENQLADNAVRRATDAIWSHF